MNLSKAHRGNVSWGEDTWLLTAPGNSGCCQQPLLASASCLALHVAPSCRICGVQLAGGNLGILNPNRR